MTDLGVWEGSVLHLDQALEEVQLTVKQVGGRIDTIKSCLVSLGVWDVSTVGRHRLKTAGPEITDEEMLGNWVRSRRL
jgi:hypothetical protein